MVYEMKRRGMIRILLPIVLAFFYFSIVTESPKRIPWYQEIFYNALYPFEWVLNNSAGSVKNIWGNYISLIDVHKDNEALKVENAGLKGRLIQLQETERENERLASLLAYKNQLKIPTIAAKVLTNDPRAEFKSITIDKGFKDGVDILMPVVGSFGLVGRTERVFAHRSHVLLIIDPNSAIDVQVLRSGARAILVGMMRYAELRPLQYLTRLEYLDGRSDIRENDLMITSGFDGIYPAGLPVGEVKNLEYQTDAIFKSAEIIPMEELSQIKEVLILQTISEKEES